MLQKPQLEYKALCKLAEKHELDGSEAREYLRATEMLDEYPTVEQIKKISNNFIGLCTSFLCSIFPEEAHEVFDAIHSNYLADCIQYGIDLGDEEDSDEYGDDEYEEEGEDTCEFDFDFEPSLHLEEDEEYEYLKTNPWKKLGIKLED